MILGEKLKKSAEDWQRALLEEYKPGNKIHFLDLGKRVCWAFSRDSAAALSAPWVSHGPLPRVKAIVVGLDIREYSRRRPESQLFLTMFLHACIRKTLVLLRKTFLAGSQEPRILIQTGDGAYIVFTFVDAWNPFDAHKDFTKVFDHIYNTSSKIDWKTLLNDPGFNEAIEHRQQRELEHLPNAMDQAMAFVFALNAIIVNEGAREGFEASPIHERVDEGMPAFPAECRFALSFDEVLLLETNGALNCVGSGMVTCARILATDSGNHLLIDYAIIKALEKFGGLPSLCKGRWSHRLHGAVLDEVKVKSGNFRYADVFGFYTDAPMLEAINLHHTEPKSYHIGSHNVLSVDT